MSSYNHPSNGSAPVDGPVIVVIDGHPPFLRLMQELLTDEGYQVILWQRSADAHALIEQARPRLVLLDVHIEAANAGLRLLEQLRRQPATAQVPVILCSADGRVVRERAGLLRAYRAAVLPKPFDLTELLTMIEQQLAPARPPVVPAV